MKMKIGDLVFWGRHACIVTRAPDPGEISNPAFDYVEVLCGGDKVPVRRARLNWISKQ